MAQGGSDAERGMVGHGGWDGAGSIDITAALERLLARVSSKEKGSDVEGRFVIRAVPVMEVGPPGLPCRRGVQTAVMSCRSVPGWEAITETAR